jgi:hypothetical protein
MNGVSGRWRAAARLAAVACALAALTAPARAAAFTVYDQITVGDDSKPDLEPWGLVQLQVIDQGRIWPNGADTSRLPDRKVVNALADFYSAEDVVVLDVNPWSLNGAPAEVAASVAKYATLLRWFHAGAPSVRFGYFGKVPFRDFNRALYVPGTTPYAEWQSDNDVLRPIARAAGVLLPIADTPTIHAADWRVATDAAIAEARRLGGRGKLLLPILRPRYTCCDAATNQEIGAAPWRAQLAELRRTADGLVIDDGLDTWKASAGWWRTTRTFTGAKPSAVLVSRSAKRILRAHALLVRATCPAACSLRASATLTGGGRRIVLRGGRFGLATADETRLRIALPAAARVALAASPTSLTLEIRLVARRLVDGRPGRTTLRVTLRP